MNLKDLTAEATKIKVSYDELNQARGNKLWGVSEFVQGLVGDVGDLTKLIMAHQKFRKIDDLDNELKHELVDCLWALLIISKELDVDLEAEFLEKMKEFDDRIKSATEES